MVFTYLASLLEQITGFSASSVGLLLLVYGVAIALGNMWGGKVSNHNPARILTRMFIAQAAVLALFSFTAPFQVPAVVTLFLIGGLSFATVPGFTVICSAAGAEIPAGYGRHCIVAEHLCF